jgi:pimeloyl-ACP methyl ester carboxylesterase
MTCYNNIQAAKNQSLNKTYNSINVIWIHGANQSSTSFTYLRDKCNFRKEVFVNYGSKLGFQKNLDRICEQVGHIDECFIVAHSMGGLYALHLIQRLNVKGVVSISTPFNGSRTADWAKFFVPRYPLFKDAGKRSIPVKEGHKIIINCPWTQIVSTAGGVPYHEGPNDGVCTTASMIHRKDDMEIVSVANTHFEVMVSLEVAEIIENKYQNIQSKLLPVNDNHTVLSL